MLRASHMVLKTYDDAYRPFGIRATQLPVLNLIAMRGNATIKEIADETVTERSVLSRKLQVMLDNGWLSEQTNPSTREKVFVLTDSGRALLDQVMPVRRAVQDKLLTHLSYDERRLLLNLCDKLRIGAN
ncbi:MAG: MarR family winged helix-turn-helix transcriptional regulator [Gammaproteobacteria bacterium]|nr:MarR family winged helix-turn-helix transcriptional regulator [Gammaproteobacteria bacterium]